MCKVLYVDDDISSCGRLKMAFDEANQRIEVDCACTALEAIAKIVNDRYDLFILNLWFSELDSVEICQWIKRCDRRGPVMILSTPTSDIQGHTLQAGADLFLESPVDVGTLADRALNCLSVTCADLHSVTKG